jgi:hypothetical protein
LSSRFIVDTRQNLYNPTNVMLAVTWNSMRSSCGYNPQIMRTLALLLLVCPACFAQSVTVRVINDEDGRGLAKQGVSVQFFYEKPAQVSAPLHLETDSKGEAQFSIPEPAPAHLFVHVALTSEHWHCGCGFMGATDSVVHNGIRQDLPAKSKSTPRAKVEPGYIVFVARPFSLVEKLLYPLEKE